MQVVHPRCDGLDVHKRTVVACRLIRGHGAQALRAVRTFGTTTRELLALVGWLAEEAVTHVAMESTGSYCSVDSSRAATAPAGRRLRRPSR